MTRTENGASRAGVNDTEVVEIGNRLDRIEDQLFDLNADKKEIYSEARSRGYNIPALKIALRIRREDATKREKREQIDGDVGLYLAAFGIRA